MATKKTKKAAPKDHKFLVIREDCGNYVGSYTTMEEVNRGIEEHAGDGYGDGEGNYLVFEIVSAQQIYARADAIILEKPETAKLKDINW